jgi:hypothetical protein
MPQTMLGDIIVNALVVVDAILGKFVTGTSYSAGNLELCVPSAYTAGGLTACGTMLVAQIPQLAVSGIGLLNTMFVALGAA